jgi:hypothetical protein
MVETMKFDHLGITDVSDRTIEGRASLPTVDREKEIILRKALEGALPYYMELPVITYNHTERPVGLFTEAYIGDDGGLYVKGKIKKTPDADDVWDKLQNGLIKSLSISGRRLKGNSQCKLNPNRRTEPCVTEEAHIYAITLVGDGHKEVNPNAYVNIVKSITEDTKMTDESNPDIEVTEQIEKSDIQETPVIDTTDLEQKLDMLVKSVQAMSETQDSVLQMLNKSETVTEPPAEQKDEPPILKSDDGIEKAVKEFTDMFETKMKELVDRIEKLEEQPISKADVNPVIITNSGEVLGSNYEAIRKSQERK